MIHQPRTADELVESEQYRLFCEGRLADPYPLLAWLRSNDPVHWSPIVNAWILTRYDDVLSGLLDKRFANDRVSASMAALSPALQSSCAPLGEHVSNWLGYTDPPKHTRLRGLLRTTFTPALADGLGPRIGEIVDELLDAIADAQRPDLIASFAFQLPARVICEILGVPIEHAKAFHRWSDDMAAFTGNLGPTLVEIAPRAMQSYVELEEFMSTMVAERARCPSDDLLNHLAQAETGAQLSRPELIGLSVFTLVAGHETTASLLANALLIMLGDQALRTELERHPELLPNAVEEFLRIEAPIQFSPRLAAEDVESRGRTIRRGDVVMLHLGAANRDPERFPEPHRIDLHRVNNRHLSFAWGPHFCLGAPLARIEASVALPRLFERFPNIRATEAAPPWRKNMTMRAVQRLYVDFGN
jgi:pimeloyl-[acyl-carrier protein] synthase